MEERFPAHVEQLLRDLHERAMWYRRAEAADALGKLSTSSVQIVVALVVARDYDADLEVRKAAAAALLSPVHHTVLEQNSEIVMQMVISSRPEVDKVLKAKVKTPETALQKLAKEARGIDTENDRRGLLLFITMMSGVSALLYYWATSNMRQTNAQTSNPYTEALLQGATGYFCLGTIALVFVLIAVVLYVVKFMR